MHAAIDPNREASAALIAEHYPLARSIASRMHRKLPPGIDLDELVSIALIGLLEACSRFDPSRGIQFRTFAKHRMHGAILDSLRSADWIPRSVRERAGTVQRASERLRNELGREPTTDEVAKSLDVPVEVVREARQADTRPVLSLDAPAEEDGGSLIDFVMAEGQDAGDVLEEREMRRALLAAVVELPERERIAVEGFYLRGEPLKGIGKKLGVSESRACQLCRQGTMRLRKILKPRMG